MGDRSICPSYDRRFEFIVQSDSMKLETPIPILRIFDEAKAKEFYFDFLAQIIHECRREAFETEARRGFSHVRPM